MKRALRAGLMALRAAGAAAADRDISLAESIDRPAERDRAARGKELR
jgi:hypothetical protein